MRALLDKYVDAFWRKDVDTLATLLAEDAVWEMPPFANWYLGARNIADLVDTQCPGGVHDMPMVATVANGQPAFGLPERLPADVRPDAGPFRSGPGADSVPQTG